MPLPKDVFVELFRNSEVMAEFLRATLKLTKKELSEIIVQVPEGIAPDENVRDNLLQVLTTNKKLVNVELLLNKDPELLLATKRYGASIALQMEEAKARGWENELPYRQVIQVHILDFEEASCGDKYHNQFVLWDNNKDKLATDAYAYHIFILPRLSACRKDAECRAWLEFLQADQLETLERLAKEHEAIGKAVEILKEIGKCEE